jgi:predicted CXXCH cytochrome family protein
LENFFATLPNETLTIGLVQYKIGDGVIRTVSGVRAWVANTAAPASRLTTTSYYTLYEMDEHIFIGYLQKANTRIRQVSAIDGTELLEYSVRFNAAAINSIKQTLTAIEFALTNQSFHPVKGEGKNPLVISLISPYREKKTSSSDVSMLLCADCHGSVAPYQELFTDNYSTGDNIAESSFAYALCYKCHNRSSILGNESFPSHSRHVAGEGNFKGGGTSCHTCHSSHGSVENKYLIRFNRDFVSESSTGKLQFVERGTYAMHGECYLTCHGVDHNPKSY